MQKRFMVEGLAHLILTPLVELGQKYLSKHNTNVYAWNRQCKIVIV